MLDYELKEIEINDYEQLKEYFMLRRPETADSNILDLYIWKDCYPTRYFTNDIGLMWIAKSEDNSYYSTVPCCKDEDLKKCFADTKQYFNEVLKKKLTMYRFAAQTPYPGHIGDAVGHLDKRGSHDRKRQVEQLLFYRPFRQIFCPLHIRLFIRGQRYIRN